MSDRQSESSAPASGESPLEGWKEIAAYLQRDVRTVSRWEKREALPIRRHQHGERSTVYAFPSELDRWRAERAPAQPPDAESEKNPRNATSYWPWALGAAALVGAVALITGPILNPPTPLVDAAGSDGIVASQLWSEDGVDDSGGPSPDATRLLYIDWKSGGLQLRDLESGGVTVLVPGDSYKTGNANGGAFRPDGQAVAYVWEEYGDPATAHVEVRLLEIHADGSPGRMRTILESPDMISISGWFPDAERILVSTRGRNDRLQKIAVANLALGTLTVLKTLGWEEPTPILSPDGRWVAYDIASEPGSVRRDIWALATDGSMEHLIVSHPADDAVACWSPDGQELLFTSDRGGSTSLYSIRPDSGRVPGEPVIVKAASGPIRPLGPPVGGRLFYSVAARVRQIWSGELSNLERSGANLKLLQSSIPGSTNEPAFSPDGSLFAYMVTQPDRPNATRLVVRDLRSGAERSFGHETVNLVLNGAYSPVSFAPDSRRILFQGWNRKGRLTLAILDSESGEISVIPSSPNVDGAQLPLAWIDNETILIRDADRPAGGFQSKLTAVDVSSGSRRDIRQTSGPQHASVSPDGKRILYADREELVIVDVRSGETLSAVQKPGGGYSVAWPQGGALAYYSGDIRYLADDRRVWMSNLVSGESREIRLGIRQPLYRLAVHPDGKRIAIEAGVRIQKEIWTLENFLAPSADQVETAQ